MVCDLKCRVVNGREVTWCDTVVKYSVSLSFEALFSRFCVDLYGMFVLRVLHKKLKEEKSNRSWKVISKYRRIADAV